MSLPQFSKYIIIFTNPPKNIYNYDDFNPIGWLLADSLVPGSKKEVQRTDQQEKVAVMRKVVFYTGAGMSRESGLPTFRGQGGLWDTLDVEAVADRKSWHCGRRSDCNERRQRVLDFFNPIRRLILDSEPNEGHRIIAGLEGEFDVTIVTQNGDDFHERAGSTRVIHLHGEALKNASTLNPCVSFDIDPNNPDIRIGDKAPDGSQVRPYVVFFNEDVEQRLWNASVEATHQADVFVVVGSSMLVYPAAELLKMIPPECGLYIIDPGEVALPEGCERTYIHIQSGASDGLEQLKTELKLK